MVLAGHVNHDNNYGANSKQMEEGRYIHLYMVPCNYL